MAGIKKVLLVLLKILAVIAGIILISASCIWGVREYGKHSLYQSAESASLTMDLEEAGEEYQEGDVIYQDEIYRYNQDVLTFLLMGIDTDRKVPNPKKVRNYTKGGQADALFLVVADPHTKKMSLVNINRNTMVDIDIYDRDNTFLSTKLQQICLQHGYGTGGTDSCERQVKAVSELFFKQPIYGYAAINMGAISKLNDLIGGVEVELLERFSGGDVSAKLKQPVGTKVLLKGRDAYAYLRKRDIRDPDSVMKRLKRQKQYLEAFAAKAMSMVKQDIGLVAKMYSAVSNYLVTDVDLVKATYLASEMVNYSFDFENSYVLQGETVIGPDGFEEFYVDDDALYELMIQLFYEKVS